MSLSVEVTDSLFSKVGKQGYVANYLYSMVMHAGPRIMYHMGFGIG